MASEGNCISDELIGRALIKEVIQEELNESHSENMPPLTTGVRMEVDTVHERKIVDQLTRLVRIIGDQVKDNQELKDAIDGVSCPPFKWDRFKKVTLNVIQDGITWERIALLIYIASKLAVKMVEASLPALVKDILLWTVDFFRDNLLGWIRDHGGWINSFSDLAMASMRSVSSASAHKYGLVLIFIAGLAVGSFITWRLTKRL